MHILYLHQYFMTRAGVTGTRSYEFSRHLIGRGHAVTMVTSGRRSPMGYHCPPDRDFARFDVEGIDLVAINAAYNDSDFGTALGGTQRMLAFLHFARLAYRLRHALPRPDVVFATSTPLTIGLAGMKLARHFGVPFVFEVRDLWPDALINFGALRNPLVIWWLRRMEQRIYRAADQIVALSPGMKAHIVRCGVPDARVTMIPNSSDLDLFRPDLDGSAERARLGLGDRFAAIYFGAMGRANGLEYVVEAAQELRRRNRNDIVLVLHGSGGRREALQQMVREARLDNVIFSDKVNDKTQVARIVAGCNAGMTIYAGTDKEQTWSPNKMFDALAAGRPVLINVPGWLGETVEKNRAGRMVDPHRPAALADALCELADNPSLASELGRNARALAESQFSRARLADELERVLLAAVQRGAR